MNGAAPLLELRCVTRSFDGGRIVGLSEVSLSIEAGDSLAVVGASGSGKSCLVNAMTGIDRPDIGEVSWRGQKLRTRRAWTALRRDAIGIVFQEFNLMPTLTALENVEIATFGRGMGGAAQRRTATAALEQTGLAARLDHLPNMLSGGERQRVAIARSIVNKPELLVADEPTGNLDSVNARLITDLLFDLCRTRHMALVLVTHDRELALRCARRMRLRDGRVVESSRSGVAEDAALAEPAP
jgi:putative ABC transport system ATP-binding protein